MLNITYRLNDILAEWPSKQFYEGKLVPSPEAAKHRLKLSKKSTRWDFILDPTSPVVFIDICNQNTTIRSHREGELVVELILALLEHQIPADEIGVVVPYRAQSRLTRSLLRRQIKDEDILSKVAIDTVERMQGQEREIILVSFTTASPAFASQMADFLFQPQRLNVAVTRPKAKLILIGSHHMLSGQGLDQDHKEIYQLLKNLLDSGITFTIPDGLLD